MSDTDALNQRISELTSQLQEAHQKVQKLQEEVDRLNPADPKPDEETILKLLGLTSAGLRCHEIESETKFPESKVRHYLARLESPKLGLIATHGGGEESLRYKLTAKGKALLVEKEMI